MTAKDKPFDFAKALKELEEINRWFQNEEIDLDEGLAKFRRGLELIKKSKGRLKQVEIEFNEIKKEFGGEEKASEELEELTDETGDEGEGIPF